MVSAGPVALPEARRYRAIFGHRAAKLPDSGNNLPQVARFC
jgi:hypothetical protein